MKAKREYAMGSRADGVVKTRERIVAATTELIFAQAYEYITLNEIAAAAGVSHQTVLNHFESKEGVARAVVEKLKAETTDVRYSAKKGDAADAVRVLTGEYERFGDANARWASSAERLGSLASALDDARAEHQRWIEHMFDDALPSEPARRARTVHAIHVATDVYTWKLLRRDLGVTRAQTEQIMTELLEAVLATASNQRNPSSPSNSSRTRKRSRARSKQ
jgi:AcrR family transcriptional regulator